MDHSIHTRVTGLCQDSTKRHTRACGCGCEVSDVELEGILGVQRQAGDMKADSFTLVNMVFFKRCFYFRFGLPITHSNNDLMPV